MSDNLPADHQRIADLDLHTDEGGVSVAEYKCGPKFVLADTSANYCPRCGDEL